MNSIDQANLTRSHQMSAAIAIAELCNRKHLPEVHSWMIRRDRVIVQLLPAEDEPLHGIGVWSREFGGARVHVTGTLPGGAWNRAGCVRSSVAIDFEYRGVRFHAWTGMPADKVPAAWAAGTEGEVPAA